MGNVARIYSGVAACSVFDILRARYPVCKVDRRNAKACEFTYDIVP